MSAYFELASLAFSVLNTEVDLSSTVEQGALYRPMDLSIRGHTVPIIGFENAPEDFIDMENIVFIV